MVARAYWSHLQPERRMDRDLARWALVAAAITAGSISTCAAGLALAPVTSTTLLDVLFHVEAATVTRIVTPIRFIVGAAALTALAALLTAGVGWMCTCHPFHRVAHR